MPLPEPQIIAGKFVDVKFVVASTVTKQTHSYLGEPGSSPRPLWHFRIKAA
mgnify:CR=1 FL=1